MNIDKDKVNKIIQFLTENIKPYLIYLFGSSVNGIFREDSDIDIAFISDINTTVFRIQVIAKGEKIYCIDNKRRAYFEMYAFKDYATLNEEREIVLKNIKKRGKIYE